MFELQNILKNLLLPPGILIFIGLWGVLSARRVLGKSLMTLSIVLLLILSLPFFADRLLCEQQTIPPLRLEQATKAAPEAIVVLGGGSYRGNTEYGGDTVSESLLVRLRYAAWLAKRLDLPVIPSGGSARGKIAEAVLAKEVLEGEFDVQVAGIEDTSRTTWENATNTHKLLGQLGINRVLLVTNAWHMPRALKIFTRAGVDAIPAPTLFQCPAKTEVLDWVPTAKALENSRTALHEILGRAFYDLKHWLKDLF